MTILQSSGEARRVKKGRSNWNKPGGLVHVPAGPSSSEEMARTLGLRPSEYLGSAELKQWVAANKNSRYVPLELLKAWGLAVDADL
jgi:hypothetical protein